MKREYKVLNVTFRIILIFMIIYLLLLSCGSYTTLPTTARYPITNQDRIFNASFDEIWSEVVSLISSLQWETKFIDKSSGVIKLRASWIYSDMSENSIKRVYNWPNLEEVEFSNVLKYITECAYSKIGIPGIPKYSREYLTIKIIKVSSSKTQVDIKYTINVFSSAAGLIKVNSNGYLEYQILSNIKSELK